MACAQELAQQLPNVTMLVLDHNRLRHVPVAACRLPRLEVLSACANSIAYLPDALAGARCGAWRVTARAALAAC